MPKNQIRRTFLLLFVTILLASSLQAQDRGSITGIVTDASSAVVPEAAVKVTNVARGEAIDLKTSSAGIYSAQNLIAGAYSVSVTVPGFRTSTVSGVEVRVGEVTRTNVQLQLGEVSQNVDVRADILGLKTESSDIGTSVQREAILNLPLQVGGAIRDPIAFVKLTPGFNGGTSNSSVDYTTYNTFNGSQSGALQILIDGADISRTSVQTQFNTGVSVEGVEEFKVMSSVYSAEYGRGTGGIVNLTLKSGTNDFHGSVYDFLRNDKLDARGFFNPRRQVNRQNDFGALVSGPIKRDKTFFMFAYEGFRYREGALNQLRTYPIDDFRRGDFSKLVDAGGNQIPIYDPASTQLLPNGTVVRQQFPGNVIPSTRIDPVSSKVLGFFPKLDFPDRLTNNLFVNQRNVITNNVYTAKVDHAISSRQKITGTFSRSREKVQDLRAFEPLGGSGLVDQKPYYARLAHDFVISPTVLNHVQFGYSRLWRAETPLTLGDFARQIGLNNVGQIQFPIPTIAGYSLIPPGYANVLWVVDNAYQFNEALTFIKGRHTLKVGGEVRKQQFNANEPSNSGGFSFGTAQTGLPGIRSGDGFASFLLGAVSGGSWNYLGTQFAARLASMGVFVQDDFKVTPKFTLNLGLRYERYWPLSEATGRITALDAQKPNPGADGRPGALMFGGEGPGRTGTNRFQDIYNRAFGPRVGLAYQLNERTVVRTGYGIYYQELKAPTWGRGMNEGFFTNVNYSSPDGYTPAFYWRNDFPTDFPRPPFLDPAFANGRNVAYAKPESGRPPVAQNWQLSIQRQLTQTLNVDLAYVGSKGNHLIAGNEIFNHVDPRYLSLGTLLDADIDSPAAQAAGIAKPYPSFRGRVNQALRPFPQYLTVAPFRDTFGSDKTGNSTYHAFQAKFEGRMRGLNFMTAYTFSKNITDNANNRDKDIYALNYYASQNGFNRRAEKTLAQLDIPHNVVINFLYDLPFGPGRANLTQGVASKILGGWSFGSVLTYQSGLPIATPSPATSRVPLFAGAIRPNRVAGASALTAAARNDFDPGRDHYLNSAAWVSPDPFSFGNAPGVSEARIEPLLSEDVSLLKSTRISERINLQFRAEAFNLFNRTEFGFPIRGLARPDFGRIFTQQNKPRQIQFGLKLIF
ncbi:MAG: carboxypeptidase regulatory-like domain-containing protein [Acidobacteria bacterium]|nr:carboxypeptidase regulatory-like domain-containing protein [Acidobacteriota bacterium]